MNNPDGYDALGALLSAGIMWIAAYYLSQRGTMSALFSWL